MNHRDSKGHLVSSSKSGLALKCVLSTNQRNPEQTSQRMAWFDDLENALEHICTEVRRDHAWSRPPSVGYGNQAREHNDLFGSSRAIIIVSAFLTTTNLKLTRGNVRTQLSIRLANQSRQIRGRDRIDLIHEFFRQ